MEIFLFNFLFAILISTIFAILANSGINFAGVLIAGNTLKKVANELEFYHAVIEPVSDFNLVGVDFLNNTFASAFKTISSENYSLLDFANENFAIVKDMNINAFTNV